MVSATAAAALPCSRASAGGLLRRVEPIIELRLLVHDQRSELGDFLFEHEVLRLLFLVLVSELGDLIVERADLRLLSLALPALRIAGACPSGEEEGDAELHSEWSQSELLPTRAGQ